MFIGVSEHEVFIPDTTIIWNLVDFEFRLSIKSTNHAKNQNLLEISVTFPALLIAKNGKKCFLPALYQQKVKNKLSLSCQDKYFSPLIGICTCHAVCPKNYSLQFYRFRRGNWWVELCHPLAFIIKTCKLWFTDIYQLVTFSHRFLSFYSTRFLVL